MKTLNVALLVSVILVAGVFVLPLSISMANAQPGKGQTQVFKCDTAKECKAIFERVSGNVVIEFSNSGGSTTGTVDNDARAKNTQQDQQITALQTENTGLKGEVASLNSTVTSQGQTIGSLRTDLDAAVAQNAAQDSAITSMNASLQDVITGIEVNQTGGNTTVPPVVCVDPQVLNTTSNQCETPVVPPVICEPPAILNATSNQCETPVVIPPVDNGTGNQTGNNTGGGGIPNDNSTGGGTGNESGNLTG